MKPFLKAGLAWLYETVQPPGAILQHHGVSSPRAGGRSYGFVPVGAGSRPVVIIRVAQPRRHPDDGTLLNPLSRVEVDAVAAEIAKLGYDVADVWNGAGHDTGSFGLSGPAHPSLVAAVDRYRAGCPEHPQQNVFCDCGWYQQGNALVVGPDWGRLPHTCSSDPGGVCHACDVAEDAAAVRREDR